MSQNIENDNIPNVKLDILLIAKLALRDLIHCFPKFLGFYFILMFTSKSILEPYLNDTGSVDVLNLMSLFEALLLIIFTSITGQYLVTNRNPIYFYIFPRLNMKDWQYFKFVLLLISLILISYLGILILIYSASFLDLSISNLFNSNHFNILLAILLFIILITIFVSCLRLTIVQPLIYSLKPEVKLWEMIKISYKRSSKNIFKIFLCTTIIFILESYMGSISVELAVVKLEDLLFFDKVIKNILFVIVTYTVDLLSVSIFYNIYLQLCPDIETERKDENKNKLFK